MSAGEAPRVPTRGARRLAVAACAAALVLLVPRTEAADALWPECASGTKHVRLILKVNRVANVFSEAATETGDLWFDFKQFELDPALSPLGVHLRLLVEPGAGGAERRRYVAAIVRMAEGEAIGEYHGRLAEGSAGPEHLRAGTSWSKPREGILWAQPFAVGEPGPDAPRDVTGLVPVDVSFGAVPVDQRGAFTFVVRSQEERSLHVRRGYATLCHGAGASKRD